jgi:hypothetical protein
MTKLKWYIYNFWYSVKYMVFDYKYCKNILLVVKTNIKL